MNSTRWLLLLSLGCISFLPAATIVAVSGPSNTGAGIFQTNAAVAASFTVTNPYSSVSISADLIGSFTGTVRLLNQLGPGTTAANELANTSFTSAGAGTPLLQNLSLGTGTYYILLTADSDGTPQGWSVTGSPTTVLAPGASTPFGFYFTNPFFAPPYLPSANFLFTSDLGGDPATLLFSVTGTAEVPEPASAGLMALAAAAVAVRAARKWRVRTRP